MLTDIDVVITTYNEAPNIGRVLAALERFSSVVILDSGSTDDTLAIARRFPNVRIESNPFVDHATQWNHALSSCGLTREWLLALDADYVFPAATVDEIARLHPQASTSGFVSPFRYSINGHVLRSCMYPPRVVLMRRLRAHAVQDGHAHRMVVDGETPVLREPILHDDRKPLSRWLASQLTYANLEVKNIASAPWGQLGWADRLRRLIVVMPWLAPLYCLVIGRGLLDGRAGLHYALQRSVAESILSLKLIEAKLMPGEAT